MLKAVLDFCQKSAKIMLTFFKSTRGLQKNAHFFPNFLNIEYYIFQIFTYIFQQKKCNDQFFFPLVLFFPLIDGRVRSRAISALAS